MIKDDHGITNQPFCTFEERIKRCAAAVAETNAQTGQHTLYAANVSADGEAVLERAHYAKAMGATALMVAPALVGYGWLHRLATDDELGLPIITHPAMMGGFVLPGISGIADYLWMAYCRVCLVPICRFLCPMAAVLPLRRSNANVFPPTVRIRLKV